MLFRTFASNLGSVYIPNAVLKREWAKSSGNRTIASAIGDTSVAERISSRTRGDRSIAHTHCPDRARISGW